MLSKYDASEYTPSTVINYTTNTSLSQKQTKTIATYTPTFKKGNISLSMFVWDNGQCYFYVYVKKNGTAIYTYTTTNVLLDTTITIENIYNTDTITIDVYNPDGSYWRTTATKFIWEYTKAIEYIPKKSLPFELKSIGNKLVAYLFGKLPNGTRWDGN